MEMDPSPTDLASRLVQEVAASLSDQPVPDRYIQKDGFPPAEKSLAGDILIDFSRLSTEDELRKLRSALSTWGCVQLVNHGIEPELLEKALEVSREFFALPLEEKKKSYGAPGTFNGYGNDGVLRGDRTQNWNDGLFLRVASNDPADLRFWPETPPDFRKTVRELADKVRLMPEMILKAMARSLDLEEDCFLKHHGLDGGYAVKINLYPRCPSPDRVLGIAPHSDGTTFTMLLQDQQGLEVMANDRWFKVPVVPGAMFLNVGDLMEVMSNGALKSTLHRVVTNSEKHRVSVAMFYNPSHFKEIGPVDQLVSADQPPLYKKTTIIKYGQMFKDCILKGQRPLLALKL